MNRPVAAADLGALVLPGGGSVSADEFDLRDNASDLGNIVDRCPSAIVRPRSTEDVVTATRWCRDNGIPMRAHGTRHTTGGQALPPTGGVQVDMRSMDRLHHLDDRHVDAEAGVLLSDVVWHAWCRGRRLSTGPTSYLKLSVGGVLSVGGISSCCGEGALIDGVTALELVTPGGEVLWCTPQRNRSWFNAALGGRGAAGVLTRAQLSLTPVPPLARVYEIGYRSLPEATRAARALALRGEVDDLLICWSAPQRRTYRLLASSYHRHGEPPDDAHLLRGLDVEAETRDVSYWQHVSSTDAHYAPFESAGWDRVHKVWADYLLPDSSLEAFLAATEPEITDLDLSTTSFGLLFPHLRRRFTRTGLALPAGEDELVWLFDVLSDSVNQTDPFWLPDRLRRNERWLRRARSLGGAAYPVGTQLSPRPLPRPRLPEVAR